MKKLLVFIFALFLLSVSSSFLSAINLQIEKTSSDEVLIVGINKQVSFNVKITNIGESDNFVIYNLIGFKNIPEDPIAISKDETKDVTIEVWPTREMPDRGYYTITLYIRSATDYSQTSYDFTFKIAELKDVFEISSTDINPQSTSATVSIKNKESYNFDSLDIKLDSPFFKSEKNISLGPKETKQIQVNLNKEDFRDLTAGFYTLKSEIKFGGKTAEVNGLINFVEKGIVTTTRKDFGFFVNTQVITKINEGNKVEAADTTLKKNVLSRLFTSFSQEPDNVERVGSSIYYTWTRELKPGEKFELSVKTNWLFPFILVLFVILVVISVRNYVRSSISLKKSVQFVRAKGGEFALKVSITVHAKRFIERVNITDRLPPLVSLYGKFGGNAPTRMDEKTRRLEWNFDRLMPGEVRVLSYIIYSKVGVMGKFALPTATAIYEREGEIHEEESNKAFFVAEQKKIEE